MRLKIIGLVSTIALGLFTGTLPADAQEAKKVFRVGVLSNSTRPRPHYVAFVQGLRKLGYVEGQNLTVEARAAEGQLDRVPSLAAELVRLGSNSQFRLRNSPPVA
jgi:putative tryptophan/tyrosine transport system substrate-binding protein